MCNIGHLASGAPLMDELVRSEPSLAPQYQIASLVSPRSLCVHAFSCVHYRMLCRDCARYPVIAGSLNVVNSDLELLRLSEFGGA